MDVLYYELCQAIAGQKPPQKALDDAAAKWVEITNRLGKEKQLAEWKAQLKAMKDLGAL